MSEATFREKFLWAKKTGVLSVDLMPEDIERLYDEAHAKWTGERVWEEARAKCHDPSRIIDWSYLDDEGPNRFISAELADRRNAEAEWDKRVTEIAEEIAAQVVPVLCKSGPDWAGKFIREIAEKAMRGAK